MEKRKKAKLATKASDEENQNGVEEATQLASCDPKLSRNKKRKSKKAKRNHGPVQDGTPSKASEQQSENARTDSGLKLKKKRKLQNCEEAEEGAPTVLEVPDDGQLRGMKKWIAQYKAKRPDPAVLRQQLDDFMAEYEEQEEQARKQRDEAAAADGWTVVEHKKGRKKSVDAASGVTVGGVAPAVAAMKYENEKEKVLQDFYRFQKREARRNEVMDLRLKFEEDKKRIAQMRAARKFKPY